MTDRLVENQEVIDAMIRLIDDYDPPNGKPEIGKSTDEDIEFCLSIGLNFCGCGYPEYGYEKLYELMSHLPPFKHKAYWSQYDKKLKYLLWYFMGSLDLTEHGTVIDGAWVDNKGKDVMKLLEWYFRVA
jgi:hypothetical protein